MNIRDWPMGRIMQLPDNCFGQRWPVYVGSRTEASIPVYDISEAGLPERCVIWSLHAMSIGLSLSFVNITLALGDALPTIAAEFNANETLFRDLGVQVGVLRELRLVPSNLFGPVPMRKYIAAAGRRLICRFDPASATLTVCHVVVVVSAVPTEVPDCLLSV